MKFFAFFTVTVPSLSPSMRREWIEMNIQTVSEKPSMSPSMRREWIEISPAPHGGTQRSCLPPCGGSGLKCFVSSASGISGCCLPPCGGSGLKYNANSTSQHFSDRLPPCGGSGLKYHRSRRCKSGHWSPSMRREWIEMKEFEAKVKETHGSPSMRREWSEMLRCY